MEHFRNHVYGVRFEVISDHKALGTALKSNHGNKTYSSMLTRWIDRLLHFDMEVVHQPGRTMGLAAYLARHPKDYNKKECSKSAEKLSESWFVVISLEEVNKIYYRQLSANQRLNRLFNQTMRAQNAERGKEKVESADRLVCQNKQIKSRFQNSRERNATRSLFRQSKIPIPEQIVQSNNTQEPKTSPLQSIVSSVEESSSATQITPEINFLKVKTCKEITDGLLMANYPADRGLQNVRDAVLRRDINLFRRENKLFRHVFKDLRVDRELVSYEYRFSCTN